ncbi:MAG: hypothetical protein HY238_16300 [Acidobacteria bacterium]|nr:hypothetical protein [Acidobacteriota bacterium]
MYRVTAVALLVWQGMVVAQTNTLAVSPGTLSFNVPAGGPVPVPQTIGVTSDGAMGLNFTVAVTGGWLLVGPTSGTTPANLSVAVNPAGLTPGTYTGTVIITSAGASNSPVTIGVTLVVTAAASTPSIDIVVNAGSFQPTAAAPGEIITGDTRVLFDGIPAPMIYASATQVNAIVPYEIAGRAITNVQVEFRGLRSPALVLRVVDAAPAIFTVAGSGVGQGAILNQDFSVNGALNPAVEGSIVQIFATGAGQTRPGGTTGLVTSANGLDLRVPVQRVSVRIGGQAAEVLYAGSAPGLVAGVIQINARVPQAARSGVAQAIVDAPVVLTIGDVASQAGVTIAVRYGPPTGP